MYAGCESVGGLCEWLLARRSNTGGKMPSALVRCADNVGCNFDWTRTPLDGVVPLCEQFNEQHRRALATCGVLLWLSAALQQSISPIAPPMLHDCSLECSGAPATALPATISNMTKDMRRVLMPSSTVWKGLMPVKIRWPTLVVATRLAP
jgi:hypothetical protein